MITISYEEAYIHIIVTGEFSLKDYKEFEENVLYQFKFQGRTNILFDLSQMLDYTLDVAIEELRFLRKNQNNFGRVAIVSHDQFIGWSTWLNALLSDADIRHFDEVSDACAWIVGEPDIALS